MKIFIMKILIFLLTFWRKSKGIYLYRGKIRSYSYFIGFRRAWTLAGIKTSPVFKRFERLK